MSIEVRHLRYAYGKHEVLKDICFAVSPGSLTTVLGANGAGKSTLFRCMMCLLCPAQGAIWMQGKDVSTLTPRVLSQLVAYVPQAHQPTFHYTVLEMVMMGLAGRLSMFAAPGAKERALALEALALVGMEAFAQRDYLRISGGEQQLVLIARALAQQTRVLLLDEPTANLDFGNQLRVWVQIRALAEAGYTVLLSSHHPERAAQFSSTLLALHEGRIIAQGPPEAVLDSALLQTLYGVTAQVDKDLFAGITACVTKNHVHKEEVSR